MATRTLTATMGLSLLVTGCAVDELAPPGDDDTADDDTAEPPSLPPDVIGDAPTWALRPGLPPPSGHPANVQGVTVEVHDWVAPTWPLRAGARVLFLRPDETIASETTTDASGRAAGGLPAGGTVVVINGNEITTFVGAEPNDHLVSGQPSGAWPPTPSGSVVVLPIAPVATWWYEVHGDCVYGFSTTPEVPLTLGPGCAPGTREVMGKVYTASLQYQYLSIGPVMVGPGVTTTVDGTWQHASTLTLRYGGVPAGTSIVVDSRALAGEYSIGGSFLSLGSPVAGVVTAVVDHPPPMGDATSVQTYVDGATGQRQIITAGLPGYRTDYAIPDVGGELLPWVTAITSGGATGASWTVSPGGRPADGVLVHFQSQRDAPYEIWDWYVVGPADLTSVSLPPVPGWGAFDRLFVHVELVDGPQVTSRRELFLHAFSLSSYLPHYYRRAGTSYESGRYERF